jgi:ATP phosphoribosyltransferase regulatory subunit
MSRAWLLPEHIADVLPSEARHVEAFRRQLLDMAQQRGFELVIPPMLEHVESLLSGTGQALDLMTFKLVDQLSGRLLGLRADTTPQVARIDAHLLNREGVTRLCYCGPVLHARPAGLQSSREPLQFGAEIYGYQGLEADLEVQELAIDALTEMGADGLTVDLSDARVVRGLFAGLPLDAQGVTDLVQALSVKDASALKTLSKNLPADVRDGLLALLKLFGGEEVLDEARRLLPDRAAIVRALDELRWLATHLKKAFPDLAVGFDLGETGGYAYYSGPRFSIYAPSSRDALARGGRYDEVGAVFGRNRPAVGFSLDVKVLTDHLNPTTAAPGIQVRWQEGKLGSGMRAAIRHLRRAGEQVVVIFPDESTAQCHPACDRELIEVDGQWVVRAL